MNTENETGPELDNPADLRAAALAYRVVAADYLASGLVVHAAELLSWAMQLEARQ